METFEGRGWKSKDVGVEVVGAEEGLGELGGDLVLLGQELSRAVEGDRRGAVGPDDLAEAVSDEARGQLPRDAGGLGVAAGAPLRVEQPVGGPERRRQVDGLRADVAQTRGMIRIPLY